MKPMQPMQPMQPMRAWARAPSPTRARAWARVLSYQREFLTENAARKNDMSSFKHCICFYAFSNHIF